MKKLFFVLLALLVLTACAASTSTVQTIAAQQAHNMMQDGNAFVLLDVRSAEEHYAWRIAGSLNIPYDEIATAGQWLDSNMRILIYCQTGRRSAIAAQTLAALGFKQVYDFGGLSSWPFDTTSGEDR